MNAAYAESGTTNSEPEAKRQRTDMAPDSSRPTIASSSRPLALDLSSSQAFSLFRDVPTEVLKRIVLYLDSTACPRFAAASKQSRAFVNGMPETKDRRQVKTFMASAIQMNQRGWTWSVVPFEDFSKTDPRLMSSPVPLAGAIHRHGRKSSVDCNFLHLPAEASFWHSRPENFAPNDADLDQNHFPKVAAPNLRGYADRYDEFENEGELFRFACTSPFATPSNRDLVVVTGYVRDSSGDCVIALVGKNLIGLGVGRFSSMHGVSESQIRSAPLTSLSVCCRHVAPDDEDAQFSLDGLMRKASCFLGAGNSYIDYSYTDEGDYICGRDQNQYMYGLPWNAPSFREICSEDEFHHGRVGIGGDYSRYYDDYDGENTADSESTNDNIPLHSSSPLPGFVLKLHLHRDSDSGDAEVETNVLFNKQCWGCGTVSNKYDHAGSIDLCMNFRNEEGRVRDCTFCSEDCFSRTIPIILQFHREKWRPNFHRKSYLLELPEWMEEPEDCNRSLLILLKEEGWKRKEDSERSPWTRRVEWVWQESTIKRRNGSTEEDC